jgi:hypothetical protein
LGLDTWRNNTVAISNTNTIDILLFEELGGVNDSNMSLEDFPSRPLGYGFGKFGKEPMSLPPVERIRSAPLESSPQHKPKDFCHFLIWVGDANH